MKGEDYVSYLLFRTFLQSDPVLSIRADIYFVGLDIVNPLCLPGNGALRADGRYKAQEPQIHLWKEKRERDTRESRLKWIYYEGKAMAVRDFHFLGRNTD